MAGLLLVCYNEIEQVAFVGGFPNGHVFESGLCPNREVRQERIYSIEDDEEYETTDKIIRDSKELLKQTIAGDAEAVAKALDESHINLISNRSYNNEDEFSPRSWIRPRT